MRRINDPHAMLPLVVQQYTRATEEDPSFALAWAALGSAHTRIYWYGIDRTNTRRALADAAIGRAFELVPSLPEARLARAEYLWQALGDHQGALTELTVAERALPNDPNFYRLRALVQMHMGDWDLSIADYDKALELDPRNVVSLRAQSQALTFKRDYLDVERSIERILDIAPDDGTAQVDLVHLGLYAHGHPRSHAATRRRPHRQPIPVRWRRRTCAGLPPSSIAITRERREFWTRRARILFSTGICAIPSRRSRCSMRERTSWPETARKPCASCNSRGARSSSN